MRIMSALKKYHMLQQQHALKMNAFFFPATVNAHYTTHKRVYNGLLSEAGIPHYTVAGIYRR